MNNTPILPKTFAGYIHPLQNRQHYTRGSDGQVGLSLQEAERVKVDIQNSKILNPEEKAIAKDLVDRARQMTQRALDNDGKIDREEQQAILNLATYPLPENAAPPGFALQFFRTAAGTSYAPINNRMEGGTLDSGGRSLIPHTLDKVVAKSLRGESIAGDYVAIAMDTSLYRGKTAPYRYGDIFRIPEIEKLYGVKEPIHFALVDTGSAFRGTQGAKVDICCEKPYTPQVNQTLSIYAIKRLDGRSLNILDLPNLAERYAQTKLQPAQNLAEGLPLRERLAKAEGISLDPTESQSIPLREQMARAIQGDDPHAQAILNALASLNSKSKQPQL